MYKFSNHVPPEILEANPNAEKFCTVLDRLCFEKSLVLEKYYNRLNFYGQFGAAEQKAFLYESGDFPFFSFLTRSHVIKLVENGYNIWTSKGSKQSRELFFETVFGITCNIGEQTKWWGKTILVLNDPKRSFLPDVDMLFVAKDNPDRYPFLFGGVGFEAYYNRVHLKLSNVTPLLDTEYKRKEMASFVSVLFMLVDERTCSFTIDFYSDNETTLIETLNF